MPESSEIVKIEVATWLKSIGQDREWLANQLKVSLSIVHQWLAPKGAIPEDRVNSIRLLMNRQEQVKLIGDPEGNLVSFTLDEFERIEATRQRLHYDTRPPMYRDAILAFIEAAEAARGKILPLSKSPRPQVSESPSIAAETTTPPPVTETRQPVTYPPPKRRKNR